MAATISASSATARRSCRREAPTEAKSPNWQLTGLNRAYVTMAGVDSTAAVEQRIEEAFPDRYAELHMGPR